MPLQYATPAAIEPAIEASEVRCVGINIRLPVVGEQAITYYFEAFDTGGALMQKLPLHVPLATILSEKPIVYQDVYDALKADAYERAQTVFPAGTVV